MRAFFVFLILIILVSGCVNPFGGISGGGEGVAITSFSFTPSNLKSNQLTKLSLFIENRGDYQVDDAAGIVYLFNLPNDWTISDKSELTSYTEMFGLLAPQVRGIKKYSGESRGFEWVLRAPANLPKDEVFSYIAQARVCYPYKTKIWGRLEVVSENAWLQNPPAEHAIAVQQTQGPLKVEFISKQPLMIETDVKIKVKITNSGDGVVTTNDCSVFASVVDDTQGTAIKNLNHINLGASDCTLADELYLKKGQTKETYITCTPPALGSNPISTSDFTMELIYNYYSDKKATVSVTGTSEQAALGVGGVGGITGPSPKITLTDMCSKSCAASPPQTYKTGIGICSDTTSSTVTYPGTSVDVAIDPLSSGKSLSDILGSAYTTATIKTLGLHDVIIGDLGLQNIKMSDLDTLTGKAIVSGLCSIIPDGMTMTLSGYSKDSSCTTTIAGTALSNMITVNGASGSAFKNSALSGLLINSIAGRTIGEITGNELTSINVENFKISTISSALSTAPKNFMQYTKCSGGNILTNTASTICQCVIGVSATQYPPFTGAIASVECNALCPRTVSGTPWATGGVCKKASAYGDTECSGTTTYEYFSRPAIPDPSNPPCTDATMNTCLCYRTKTLSYNAAALLCN